MKSFSLSHLSDPALLRSTAALVAQDRATTAALLAHLAEVDARKLYLPAAYPSMYAWCVGELKLSEDATFKRIRAARTAREFPEIFPMLADGRLSPSAVLLLTPYLTHENSDELLAAATGKASRDLERLLAERFPRPDVPSLVQAVTDREHATQHVEAAGVELAITPTGDLDLQLAAPPVQGDVGQLAARPVQDDVKQHAPGHVESLALHARLSPLSPGHFALQVTLGQQTHDRLRYAQALLGHAVPSGDLAQVLDRALEALVEKLEQQHFAPAARSRTCRRRGATESRHIPVAVRRLVWQRDQGRCTFVSETGHRCEATARLEFDHVVPFARGGQPTPSGLRLRCRAHNQYEAERTFGADFMRHKRSEASRRTAESRAKAKAQERAKARSARGRQPARCRARPRACGGPPCRRAGRGALAAPAGFPERRGAPCCSML